MNNWKWMALAVGLGVVASASAQVVFTDDFEDGARAGEWTILQRTALGLLGPDSRAVYGQPTSSPIESFSIPALNGTNSNALYLEVNRNAAEGASIEAIQGVPTVPDLGSAYEMEFDLFYNYSTGNTTMHFLAGVGHDGVTPWLQNTGTAPGYIFGSTADGSSSTADYRYWRGVTLQPTGTGSQGSGTGLWDNNNAFYQMLFPNPPYPTAGAPGRIWTKVKVIRNGTFAALVMNNQVTLVADDATFSGGKPFVGMIDPASSFSPVGMFVLVDNVVVRKLDAASAVTGTVTFGDWTGAAPFATTGTFLWRKAGETATYAKLTTPIPAGALSITAPGAGEWDLYFPARRPFLGKSVRVMSDGTPQTVVFDLINGDIDNDNSVTVFDYDKLSLYFDKSSVDADWSTADTDGVRPRDADLDGDLSVSVFDYDILSRNFDLTGD